MPGLWVTKVCQSGMPFFLAQKAGKVFVFRFDAWEGITSHGNVKKQEREDIHE